MPPYFAVMAYSLATLAVCAVVHLGITLHIRVRSWLGARRARRDADLRDRVDEWVQDALRIAKRDAEG
jgi:hypothetical protein